MALVLGFALAGSAQAASKDTEYRAGYDSGYQDGLRHGANDARSGARSNDRSRDSLGHKGDYGNGYRDGYQIGYRQGYRERGSYSRGYPDQNGRNGPYGRDGRAPDVYGRYPDGRYPNSNRAPWGWGSSRDRSGSGYPNDRNSGRGVAFDAGSERGYQDGLKQGQYDRDHNRGYDLWRNDDYKDGDKGYKSNYGDKRDYQNGYRRGFEDAYRAGFRGRR